MKRWLITILTLLLTLGMLISCQNEEQIPDDPGEDETPGEDNTPTDSSTPVTIGEGAVMVATKYTTDDVVVADIIATDAPYSADPTGKTDSTTAIQNALYAVEDLGGGVVYLPAGEYLVTHTVFVPAGVVLQGDWQDPNTTDAPEYGTVILARPEPLSEKEVRSRASNPLFYMDSKCGMIGLTFYYPEQNIAEPVPYGYTIYGEAPRIAALRDITMINSYRGVGVGAMQTTTHELMQNESLRICALDTAIEMYRSSEVGYTVDVCISPSYWIEAGRGWGCSDPDTLREYCKENTMGLVFNDLDDEDFSTLYIEGCRTAIYMPSTPDVPQGFWGLIYDVTIKDCMYGIVAEELCSSIGTVIAKADIDADKKAIVNSSGGGSMKLCGITLTGQGEICAEGGDIYLDEESDLSDYEIRYGSYQKPAAYLYNAPIKSLSGKKDDASPVIQQTLDEAAKTGGAVYIPAGVYSIYSTLKVPAGVQLRGPTPVFVRDASSGEPDGAVFLTYVTDGACIELAENAGVNGLRIFCPPLDVQTALESLEKNDPVVNTCIGIKGTGKGVYTYNVGVTATMIGIDFSGCDDHLIKQTFGCVYNTFAIVGGKNGVMESCLNNPHFINRQNYAGMGYCNSQYADLNRWSVYSSVSEAGVGGSLGFAELRDAVLRKYCTMITVKDAENQAINNVFMYAPYRLITVANSTATLINTSADFVGFGSVYHIVESSEVTIVNALRSAGDSIVCDETVTVDLYNRINTEIYYEGNFHTADSHIDNLGLTVTEKTALPDESTAALNNTAVPDRDPTYVRAGEYAHRHDPKGTAQQEIVYERRFDAIDISKYMTEGGYLHMWVYAEDMSTQLWGGAFEVSSAGNADQSRIYWVETSFITHDGWNEVWLPLSDVKMSGVFNPKNANYLRIHTVSNVTSGQGTFYIDDVYFCLAESDEVRYPMERTTVEEPTVPAPPAPSDAPEIDEDVDFLYVSDCEELINLGASVPLKLNDDPDYVTQGNYSFLSEAGKRGNGNEIFLFKFNGDNALDISDYMGQGYLHLSIYVEDVEKFVSGELELTSSGNCDRQELNWAPSKYITKSGWNEVYFPLNDTKSTASDFDPTKLNFIRLWMSTADGNYGNYYIDDVYFCMGVGEEDPEVEVGKINAKGDLIIATCDTLSEPGAGGMRMVTDPANIKEGSGAWWVKDNNLVVLNVKYSEPMNVSDYVENGYLHLWIWVSDASDMANGQIEITSGGDCDKNELNWSATTYIKKDGWNELYLPLATAGKTGGNFNPSAMNYFRIYVFPQTGKTIDYYIDDIRMTNDKG
ncbi:MAG: hypothetical protein IJW40_11870 [Clostridia bacterium]|nr:hypothetical protein [Clostridia bacterium]MBQ7339132.1 hypothetical protein [Clostridia bacterium]